MRIGVDLGGTKIEALALGRDGTELLRTRVSTPTTSYEAILSKLAALILEVEGQCGQQGSIGVGIPGVISPATELVKNANTTLLIGHPLRLDLEQRLKRPVRVANDANCFALSEASDGAASARALGGRAECIFGVILGTGTGGGIVVQNKLLTGRDAIGGEWGHNPLPWRTGESLPGRQCWCGQWDCIETYLSGSGLAATHQHLSGQKCSAQELGVLLTEQDPAALETIAVYEGHLARGLASIINLLNPDAIVLGGGVSNISRLYETVPQLWQKWVFSDQVTTRLVQAKFGDSSGVRGAAWLWPETSAA